MTTTVDTNVLVYAADASSPRQARARDLLQWLASGPAMLHVLWPAVMGFLRIVTHPAVFDDPLGPEEAMDAVDRLVRRPHVRVEGEGAGFWAAYRSTAEGTAPRGNLVPDAHLVALMREQGISTIWSADRDLRRFDGIRVNDPFAPRYDAGFR